MAEHDVFGGGELRHQFEILVDHPDAEGLGGGRGVDRDSGALEDDGPAVGRERPGEDFHQRGFPGAVLPEQAVHLPRMHVEVHAVEGEDPGVLLADGAHFEEGEHG